MQGLRRIWEFLIAHPRLEDLPERTREAFRAQQDRGERLVGWFQFAAVSLFGLLYALSPKTHMSMLFDSPVLWAISGYFLFTLIRLALSYRMTLPHWYLALSGAVDLTLLYSMIWSFHIQYGQPAVFYLKAPTMLYVFIFIALRALRFEPRHVLYTGLAAAAGWLVMVFYAINEMEGMSLVTRDYVAYLTSNMVLLGGEFDKVITILAVTFILAVALARGRRFVLRAVAGEAASQDLSRFFSPEIAEKITRSQSVLQSGQGENCTATIVNIDIRGFTTLAATTDASEVMCLLSEYQARVLPVLERFDGSVDKFLGDGIMVTFGASRPNERFAANALDAMQAVLEEVAHWNGERRQRGENPVRVALAAATGPILFGVVGGENRLEYTVIGDPVNLSAKLEKQNKVESARALCDQATFDLAMTQGWSPPPDMESRDNRPVEGVQDPLCLHILAHEGGSGSDD